MTRDRRSVAPLLMVLVPLALVTSGCGKRCGPSTTAVDGVCVLDSPRADGGVPDDAPPSDAAIDDAAIDDAAVDDAAVPEVTAVEILVLSPWANRNGHDPVVPVGGIVELTARGLTAAREWVPLPASALRTEGASVVGRRRDATGRTPARLSVVGIEAGTARVIASVTTAAGVTREAEIFVVVEEASAAMTLTCVSHQDRPGLADDAENLLARGDTAVVAVDLPARVLCQLEWPRPSGALLVQPLASDDCEVGISSGAGRVEDRTRVHATAPGTVELVATYAPEGTTFRGPSGATRARFVDDVPATALGLGYVYSPSVSTTPPSAVPSAPPWNPNGNGGVLYLAPSTSVELVVVTWHSVSASERYFREVPFGDVSARFVPRADAIELGEDGRLTWREPGVVGLSLAARGYELSFLVGSGFPAGREVHLRADPESIALTVVPRSLVCTTVQMFVSVDGVERPMTELETRALRRSPDNDDPFRHALIDPTTPEPTELCISSAERTEGEPTRSTGSIRMSWIDNPFFDFNTALRIPTAITWPE